MALTGTPTAKGIRTFADADSPDLGPAGLGLILGDIDAKLSAAIATFVATGSNGYPDFQSIPQTYRSLRIVYALRGSEPNPAYGMWFRFNADSGANYSYEQLYGNGATPASSLTTGDTHGTGPDIPAAGASASRLGVGVLEIPEYRSTTFDKPWLVRGVHSSSVIGYYFSGAWLPATPAAITRIQLGQGLTNAAAGSWAVLYGEGS